MIVIPIQFIVALILGGIGLVLLIITLIASHMHKAITKWRKKNEQENQDR